MYNVEWSDDQRIMLKEIIVGWLEILTQNLLVGQNNSYWAAREYISEASVSTASGNLLGPSDPYELGKESSASTTGGEFLNQLSDC